MSRHDEGNDRLADAVNQEPIVYMDCTQSELLLAISTGAAVGLTFGALLGLLIGFFMFGIIIGMFAGVGISWAMLHVLKYIRQKYYLTWLKEKLFVLKHNFLGNYQFINVTKRYGKGVRRG